MSFNTTYQILTSTLKVQGHNIAYVRKSNKVGGELSGAKMLQVGLIQDSDIYLYESPDPSSNLITVPDIDALYTSLSVAGMSEIVTGTLLANSQSVSSLEVTADRMVANILGATGIFTFIKDKTPVTKEENPRKWLIPETEFSTFTLAAEAKLTSLPSGAQADNYIVWSEAKVTNDQNSGSHIKFSSGNKPNGAENPSSLMNFLHSWTLGCTFIGEPQLHHHRENGLFKSGQSYIGIKQDIYGIKYYFTNGYGLTDGGTAMWSSTRALKNGDRILITCDNEGQSSLLRVHIGQPGFQSTQVVYANPSTVSGATQYADETFSLGQGNDISPGAGNSYEAWHRYCGLNNFIALSEDGPTGKAILTSAEIAEYFETTGTQFTDFSFYDDLFAYSELGGDPYPTVVDAKGNLTSGEYYNGSETDYRTIPSRPI